MNHWVEDLAPLIKKYEKRKHPLNYENRYQLLVVVILSAQDSDRHINEISGDFFKKFPSLEVLKNSSVEEVDAAISSVRNFKKKSVWLVEIAKTLGEDSKIPRTIEELIKLPGVGRKTANVIIRESGDKAQGIIVDLHVVRVAPRIGVATGTNPEKIEKQLMEAMPQELWNEAGMAISFHGRETCRPQPKCDKCIINSVCNYYKTVVKGEK